ncbi:MAG: alpha/beta fold hydrolase [Thermodesulfobacteriota bacterium]
MHPLQPPDMPEWLESLLPKPHRRYCMEVGSGTNMHVMESGEGYPVLMLHGNPTWGFLYRKIIEHLAGTRLRCIAPDLIGLGFSTKPRRMAAHSLENHGAWMVALIDRLSVEGLILVIQDWGGPIGMRALAERPHLLKGLVIANTAILPPKPNFRPTAFHRFSNMPLISDLVFRLFQFPQTALHKVQGDPGSIQGDVAKAYRYPLRKLLDRTAPLALARMVPSSLIHPSVEPLAKCRALAEQFKGPCEIVWGNKDPILGRVLPRIKTLLPHAGVTETNAGHFLQEEVPEQIAAAISRVAKAIKLANQ